MFQLFCLVLLENFNCQLLIVEIYDVRKLRMRVILFDYRLTMDHCRCFSNEISNNCFRIIVEFF